MIFNTIEYFLVFLFPAAIACRLVRPDFRGWICSLAGALFFLYFSYEYMAGIPAALCLFIFLWESLLSRFYRPGSWLCWMGVAQALLVLVVFKYWNFLTSLLLPTPRTAALHWEGAFLPLGVSFFTFEFIHYAVDRYRGKTEEGKLSEYLAFILFFPTMVAGPIKRYQDFLPKLREAPAAWPIDWRPGITRILVGLVKKFAVADVMTAFTNHLNPVDIEAADRAVLPLWLLAFGIKIYFDFSAYSDIAIGSARLFGIRVPENFNWPYLSLNIADFWRRWHISLGKWLTDYVFVSLGGSRVSFPRILANLLVTMLVSGIWHGAGLNFVVWGLWHGSLLVVHRGWRAFRGEASQAPLAQGLSWLATLLCVNIGWAFFCMDLPTASLFLRKLFLGP